MRELGQSSSLTRSPKRGRWPRRCPRNLQKTMTRREMNQSLKPIMALAAATAPSKEEAADLPPFFEKKEMAKKITGQSSCKRIMAVAAAAGLQKRRPHSLRRRRPKRGRWPRKPRRVAASKEERRILSLRKKKTQTKKMAKKITENVAKKREEPVFPPMLTPNSGVGTPSPSLRPLQIIKRLKPHLNEGEKMETELCGSPGIVVRLVDPNPHLNAGEKMETEPGGSPGIVVRLVDPNIYLWDVRFKRWESLNQFVFAEGWNMVVQDTGLKEGEKIHFFAFCHGHHKKLGFILARV